MSTAARTRFFEGGNVATVIAVPFLLVGSMYFYAHIADSVRPLEIKIEDAYTYIFNLFAIELGAILALFALFACRPTPFLERIKNTGTFAAIVANTNITLVVAVVTLLFTLALGLVRFEPDAILTVKSFVFLCWFWLVIGTSAIYVRTIRLILLALA